MATFDGLGELGLWDGFEDKRAIRYLATKLHRVNIVMLVYTQQPFDLILEL
jgi:hypothetical protein